MAADVSAIVVAFRSAPELPACIASLPAAAAGLDLELIVVDNASGDAAPGLVRARWPTARLIENATNRGFAAAVNQAVSEARAPLLLLLNPDTQPAPGSLARLAAALAADTRISIVGPRLLHSDGRPQPSAWRDPSPRALAFQALMLDHLFPGSAAVAAGLRDGPPQDVDWLSGACLLLRRETYAALGGLDERFFLYFEDADLCRRARAAGGRVVIVPEARVSHALGASAFRDRRACVLHFHESRRLFLRKHYTGPAGSLRLALHWGGVLVRIVAYATQGFLLGRREHRAEAGHHLAVLRGGQA